MSLQVWLPLTEDLRNQGLLNLPTPLYDSRVRFTNGKLGQYCYGDCAIYHIGQEWLGNTWSLACWVKSSNWGPYNDIILCKNTTSSSEAQFYFSIIGGSQLNIGCNAGSQTLTASYTFATNTWYHVAATYNGTTLKLYLNGNEIASKAYVSVQKTGMNNLGIGCRSQNTDGTSATGQASKCMNDVRIYDHALSPLEVKHLAQGLVLHYPLNRGGFGGENIISGTSPNEIQYTYPSSGYSDKFSPITTIVPTASQYTLSFWAKSTVNGDKVTSHYYSPNTTTTCVSNQGISRTASDGNMIFALSRDWEYYWVTYTQTETTAVKHVIFPRIAAVNNQYNLPCIGSGTISVKCVKFEEGSIPTPWVPNQADALYSQMGLDNNIEYDVSGYGNNGARNGTFSWSGDTPRYGCSTIFNGADNAIQTPNLTTMITDRNYTISCWTYKTTIGTKNYQTIYGGPGGFELEARSSSNTNPLFRLHNWGGGTTPYVFGEWTHFCFVHTDSDSKLYVNGELEITGSSVNIPSGNYYIGAWSVATSQNYDGLMSDFRIYATALSADDVMALYKNAGYVDSDGNVYAYEMTE